MTTDNDDVKLLCHKVRLEGSRGAKLLFSHRMALERQEARVGRMEVSPELPDPVTIDTVLSDKLRDANETICEQSDRIYGLIDSLTKLETVALEEVRNHGVDTIRGQYHSGVAEGLRRAATLTKGITE